MTVRAGLLVTFAGACSAPPPVHPNAAATAPLSLAADAQMIAIPAGKFVAGSTPEERGAAYDDFRTTADRDTAREQNWFEGEEARHPQTIAGYRIDLMPVTEAAYAEFVVAGKAPAPAIDEAAWNATGFTQDYATQVARFVWHAGVPPTGREDHPVVLVTWSEAAAYCAWRGELAGSPRRLPTADEYERALRGDGGLSYPWGNAFEASKLNCAVGGPGDTTPVGAYPDGASPFGVLDLAGNVAEWTSTPLHDESGEMTVKGSAWDDYGGLGRGAARHGRGKAVRHVIIGFRCAADAP